MVVLRIASLGYGSLEMLEQCHLQGREPGQDRCDSVRVKSRESGKPVVLLPLEAVWETENHGLRFVSWSPGN